MKVQGDVPETSQTSGKDVKVFFTPPKKSPKKKSLAIQTTNAKQVRLFFPAEFVDADLWSRLVYLLVDVGMMFDIFWRRSNGWGWFLGIGSVPLSFTCLRCPLLPVVGMLHHGKLLRGGCQFPRKPLDGSIHLNIIYKHITLYFIYGSKFGCQHKPQNFSAYHIIISYRTPLCKWFLNP